MRLLELSRPRALVLVKLVHTAVWALFVGCILAIAPLAWAGELTTAAGFALVVLGEVLVLLLNRWRCPLTDLAARYAEPGAQARDDFDIYLPLWLARHNKSIFGALYAAALAVLAWAWLRSG